MPLHRKSNRNRSMEKVVEDHMDSVMEDQTVRLKKKRCFPKNLRFPGLGIISALLSALFFSLNALAVKLITGIHPFQLSLSRTVVQSLFLLPLLQYKHKEVDILGPPGLKKILWLRGFVGSSAMIVLYMAINALSLGNAITITYLSMIFVPFVARIFLKESLAVFDIIFACISLTGVGLIAQPSFLFPPQNGVEIQTDEIGVVYAIATAALEALSMVIIRKLGHETYVPLSVLYYSICGSVTALILISAMQAFRYPCYSDLFYVFSLGCFGLLGQFFLTVALQYERAGTVGVLRSIQIIMVYVLQVTVLGDIPTMLSMIGAALIFSTSIGIGVRKIVKERQRRKSVARANSVANTDEEEPLELE